MLRPQSCSRRRAGERSDRSGPTWHYSALVHQRPHINSGNRPQTGNFLQHGSTIHSIGSSWTVLSHKAIIEFARWIRTSAICMANRWSSQISKAKTNPETDVPRPERTGIWGVVRPCGCLWKAVEGGSIGEGQFCEQINKYSSIRLL